MKNKHISMPLGMVTKRFHCHKCGGMLERRANTRTVSHNDHDYRKYSTVSHRHMIGDVEVTEYNFCCPVCGNTMEYDEQCVIAKLQNKLGKSVLTESEIADNRGGIEASMEKKAKVLRFALATIALVFVGAIIYIKIKSGDFFFKFYF